jgi:hypothetical protein
MPTLLTELSIAANITNPNIITGSAFEFARGNGVVSIGMGQSATGLIGNIQAGADVVAEAFPLPILTRYPIIPDEMYFASSLAQGDRLVERVQNTTAGALTVRAVTQFSFQG